MKTYSNLILAIGDLVALLLFVLLGQADHATLAADNPIFHTLRNVVALAAPWLIVAWLLRAYPRGGQEQGAPSLPGFLGRSALAWVIAAPIGLFIRMLWLGRGGIPIPFLVVTLLAGGLFLLGWRLIYWLVFLRRLQPGRPSSA